MVITLVGLFTILVLPNTVIDLMSAFGESNVPPLVAKVAVCMIYANATINVFVYAGFNGELRRTFCEMFRSVKAQVVRLLPCL